MAAIYIFVIVLGLVSPQKFADAEAAIVDFACKNFAWMYQILTVCLIGFCFWVMFNKKVGDIKLGGKDAKPFMSKWAWFVITLCGGIATGIVFWGIAEPLTHFFEGIPLFPGIEPYAGSQIHLTTSAPLWIHTDGEVLKKASELTITCKSQTLRIRY